jgi:hypothetical protein
VRFTSPDVRPRAAGRRQQQHVAERRVRADAVHGRVGVARARLVVSQLPVDRASQVDRAAEPPLERGRDAPAARHDEILAGHQPRRRQRRHCGAARQRIGIPRILDHELVRLVPVQALGLLDERRLVPVVEGADPESHDRPRLRRPADRHARSEVHQVVDRWLELLPETQPERERIRQADVVLQEDAGARVGEGDVRRPDALREGNRRACEVGIEPREHERAEIVADARAVIARLLDEDALTDRVPAERREEPFGGALEVA